MKIDFVISEERGVAEISAGYESVKTPHYLCIWFIELPSTQQTIGYNLVYNDMFRLTRVIIRLCSEPLNVLND